MPRSSTVTEPSRPRTATFSCGRPLPSSAKRASAISVPRGVGTSLSRAQEPDADRASQSHAWSRDADNTKGSSRCASSDAIGPVRCAAWIVASRVAVATSTATSAGALGATSAHATVVGVAQHRLLTVWPNAWTRRYAFRLTSTTTSAPRSSAHATTELAGSIATVVNRSRRLELDRSGRLRTQHTTPSRVMIGGLPVVHSRPRAAASVKFVIDAISSVPNLKIRPSTRQLTFCHRFRIGGSHTI